MCMAQFGRRDTQINIMPQGCMGEICTVSKWSILGFIPVAVVAWLLSCCYVLWHWTPFNEERWRLQICQRVEFWYMLKSEKDVCYYRGPASMLKCSAMRPFKSQLFSAIICCLRSLILLFCMKLNGHTFSISNKIEVFFSLYPPETIS